MRTNVIETALFSLFSDTCHIVFWDDEGGQSQELLEQLPLAEHNVTLIRRDETGDLELKVRLELKASPDERFLLYSTEAVPEPEKDWLLNIRLYSKTFSLDAASIYMEELGFSESQKEDPALRAAFTLRRKFLDARERRTRLRAFLPQNPDSQSLDLAILSVLAHCERASFEDVCLQLVIEPYENKAEKGQALLQGMTPMWDDIAKYDMEEAFWGMAKEEYGYRPPVDEEGRARPTLKHFLQSLLVTDMANALGEHTPSSLKHLLLDSRLARMASILCGDWRKHRERHTYYALISGILVTSLGIEEALSGLSAEALGTCSTFEAVERHFVLDIVARAQSEDPQHLLDLMNRRKTLYWAEWQEGKEPALYGTIYTALNAMLSLRALTTRYAAGLRFGSAKDAWERYTSELYLFDQHYRHFCHAADLVESRTDILKTSRALVEGWMAWYMTELAQAWAPILGEDGLLASWRIEDVPFQGDFFTHFVSPLLRAARSRVFVLVSDGLRYEVAEELRHAINSETRLKSELSAQLGVLPSITSLGMAALLPHTTLSFREGSADILADGRSCTGPEQRNACLAAFQGKAIWADRLTAMKTDEARDFVKDARVVYVYHDQIDSAGDHATSEEQTFAAACDTIASLKKIVRFIVDRLKGSHIFITADHGFLYQDERISETSRAIAPQKTGVLKGKKRYILGQGLDVSSAVWHGSTAVTVGTAQDASLEFCLPRGTGRFHFAGGARYTHGGAMPQEFVVPVLHVSTLSQKNAQKDSLRKVSFCLLGQVRRIVSNEATFKLLQTEQVTDRCKPRTLTLVLTDEKEAVSDEQNVLFDSASDDIRTRQKEVTLTLKNHSFDRKQEYWLVLRDAQDGAELERLPVTIDLSYL